MKTFGNYLFIILLSFTFFACEKNEVVEQQNDGSGEAVENEAAMEEISDDVNEIAFYGSEFTQSNGKVAHHEESPLYCAEITHDPVNKVIVIDYGDGCEDRRGRERQGKIIITYTSLLIFPGAEVTITFEDYYVNGVKIEGIRKITNISESLEDFVTLEVTFEDGKFIWENGTIATRDAHWVIKWIRAENPVNDEKHVDGSASGTTYNGKSYSVEIAETLIFKRECRLSYVFFPVQGVKVIRYDDRIKTINYGDGDCDGLVNITSEGVTMEVELKTRLRRGN